MKLYANPTITDFRQDVNGDIKMLKIGVDKEDAYANIQGQATSKVENNKTATINVSTYTQPVEITPTSGKTSMKKATVTLSNIPTGTKMLYAWAYDDTYIDYFSFNTAPATKSDFEQNSSFMYADDTEITKVGNPSVETYNRVSDTEIEVLFEGDDVPTTFTRDPTKDIEVW